ncbi:regulatory protein RecX [Paraglaciecola sp. MB-3u-78]|uniref:regulatory protein RecX n=1 Tax=Paraglaciecola sp. MB-3u-78 TaxID=2058332 RepID=UPI000C347BC2|nr:regulatory protein RecX [Paraglaciecola sp. MB-3u-78]PKG99361.1 RecX family transcriptional regulator [Paraglaciecola sp. MB-3u-78]
MFKKKQDAKPKEITYERVKGYYLWLIGKYGDYTSKTLMQKANSLFKEDTSFNEEALNHLLERGIVDDLQYAKRLTLSYSEKNIGPNKIRQKLYAKGFTSQIINECVESLDHTEEDYLDKALALKFKKFGESPIVDEKLKQKALRHLIGQGFSYSVANKAISRSGKED